MVSDTVVSQRFQMYAVRSFEKAVNEAAGTERRVVALGHAHAPSLAPILAAGQV